MGYCGTPEEGHEGQPSGLRALTIMIRSSHLCPGSSSRQGAGGGPEFSFFLYLQGLAQGPAYSRCSGNMCCCQLVTRVCWPFYGTAEIEIIDCVILTQCMFTDTLLPIARHMPHHARTHTHTHTHTHTPLDTLQLKSRHSVTHRLPPHLPHGCLNS